MRPTRFTLPLLLGFWPLTALVLYCDSIGVAATVGYSQWLSNFATLLYLGALIGFMRPKRRTVALIFVPLSAIGEALFSLGFGLYRYRLGMIPIYVPLGHSVLLCTGLAYSELPWFRLRRRMLATTLAALHALLIGGCLLLYGDTLSALFGVLFVGLMLRGKKPLPYLIIGVLVLYIELLGTMWGAWTWRPTAFGFLHTLNPPTGAFACYVVADMFALKVAARIDRWQRIRATSMVRQERAIP